MNDKFNGWKYEFYNCHGKIGDYNAEKHYPLILVGGLKGLLNALLAFKPEKFERRE